MNIFKKIGLWFKTTIHKFIALILDEIKDNEHLIEAACAVVANMNNFVQGGMADAITLIIPGELDDKIKDELRKWLPEVLKTAGVITDVANSEDPVKSGIAELQKLKQNNPEAWAMVSHNISALLAVKIAGGKLNLGQVFTVVEAIYQKIVKPLLKK